MMYKRYREESDAARVVGYSFYSLFHFFIVAIAKSVLILNMLQYQDILNMQKYLQVEEEKALKQLRRTLVHHARPVPKFDHPFHPQR